jgi:hypothetical protein
MFKKQKILLTGGCSYTDNAFFSYDKSIPDELRGHWDMWPNYMADELDLLLLNTARGGGSNQTIFYNIMEKLITHKDRIDTVAIMFTSFERFNFSRIFEISPISETITHLDKLSNNDNIYDFVSWQSELGVKDIGVNFVKSKQFLRSSYPKKAIENSLSYIYMIANYCATNNIKFIFSQGIVPFNMHGYNEAVKQITPHNNKYKEQKNDVVNELFLDNVWFNSIEKYKSNIVGWPLLPDLNGFYMDHLRFQGKPPFYPRNDYWCISKQDKHPIKEAQKVMGDIMIAKYKELYR